jgi:PAS domain-containing protein
MDAEAYAKLRKVENELRRILASVSVFIWSVRQDPDGNRIYRYVSPYVVTLTGYPQEHFLRGPDRWRDLVHAEDRESFDASRTPMQPGDSRNLVYRLLAKDGSIHKVQENLTATSDETTGEVYINGVVVIPLEKQE